MIRIELAAARLIPRRAAPHRAAAAIIDAERHAEARSLSNKPLEDPVERAAILQSAEASLIAAVEEMQRALGLCQEPNAILNEIKKTLHAEVRGQVGTFLWMEAGGFAPTKPGGLTVLQVLCERERATAFNQTDDKPPPYFMEAIQDFMITHDGRTPARKVRKTARNAWREHPGADRRVREMERQPAAKFRSRYRGRPEIYDPGVVWAIADGITRAAGREHFSIGHHGDEAITDKNQKGGPMLRVLVASIRWAMTIAWFGAPSGTEPPKVKPEVAS
jgi:hypothetical protein